MYQADLEVVLNFTRVLSDLNRLKIVALVAKQEYNVGDLAQQLDLKEPTVSHHLSKLREIGLVNLRSDGNQRIYKLNDQMFRSYTRMIGELEDVQFELPKQEDKSWIQELDVDDFAKKVLKDYTQDKRLKFIPTKQAKLIVVLDWLATNFEADRMYSEKEVNAILTQYHEDYARLRRELVEFGYLRRERGGGQYWVAPEEA